MRATSSNQGGEKVHSKSFVWSMVVGASLLGSAAPSFAQTPAGELSVGYQWLRVAEQNFTRGWYVDLAGNVSRVIGIVGQVGGSQKSFDNLFSGSFDVDVYEFLAGVRFNARSQAPSHSDRCSWAASAGRRRFSASRARAPIR